ncbi:MAG: DNA methyltransferase [Nitrosopumilaceae archaeon]|jgi:DNA modification methylase/Cdc6-like AAA superfamily ATPase
MAEEYIDFLKSKIKKIDNCGFDIGVENINPVLYKFQKYIVSLSLKKGKFAVFGETGTGKTAIQLSWAEEVVKKTKKNVLIFAPLGVNAQTIQKGKNTFNVIVNKLQHFDEINAPAIYISNYEQIDNININDFVGIALDESSILKSFCGKMRNKIIDVCKDVKYKLALTATPSPNDLMELGNHSEFLNEMSYSEMLAMFFVHDGGNTSNWILKNHAKNDFYSWVGEWAVVYTNPADLGFKNESKMYELPDIQYNEIKIKTPKKNNGLLFNDFAVNATSFNKELRRTIEIRMNEVKKIIDGNKNEFIIVWVKQNAEADYLKNILNGYDYREVRGSDPIQKKEKNLIGFLNKKFKILITKESIAGMGLDYSHCHIQIHAGLDFSFEKLYQSVRRSYRFGQKEKVHIHIITTDTMHNVIAIIKRKEKTFNMMRDEMKKVVNKKRNKKIKLANDTDVFTIDDCILVKGDCVQKIKDIKSESIGYSIFSPPFASLYTYSDHIEDMGNSKNYKQFFQHFSFLVDELYRVIESGRNVSVHCMNIPTRKQFDGYIGLYDFRGDIINLFKEKGFIYHSEVCIWKNPVVAMQRTKALGLLHKQIKKDSTMCRQGLPDYLITFRKPGENKKPVAGEFDHYCGEDKFFGNKNMSIEIWQRYASPVWMDINPSNTLQFRNAKDENDEKHICPLQLDVIHRALQLWSIEGDIVLDPFSGIGSTPYESLLLNRLAYAIELKSSYYEEAKKNIKLAVNEKMRKKFF